MAALSLLKLTTLLLSLLTTLPPLSSTALADSDDQENFILDSPFSSPRLRSRFIASIKKGTHCDPTNNKTNVCNGVSANKGTSLFYCCKKHCRNVLSDRNNCGRCLHKCAIGKLCCRGVCTDIAYNPLHCGGCGNACSVGLKCEYGSCGYA